MARIFTGMSKSEVLTAVQKTDPVLAIVETSQANLLLRLDRAGTMRFMESEFGMDPFIKSPLPEVVTWARRRRATMPVVDRRMLFAVFSKGIVEMKVRSLEGDLESIGHRRRYRRVSTRVKSQIRASKAHKTISCEIYGDEDWVRQTETSLRELLEPMKAKIKKHKKTVGRKIHMLMMGRTLRLKPVAAFHDKLVRENYSEKVLEQYDHMLESLSSPDPDGRLAILRGPPGTGKTYMVRGAIEAIHNIRFILVPASMLSQFTGPGLSQLLLRQKVPTCLVLEDADELLIKRMGDNMTSVAAMLAIADGLFGEIADVRVLCTTNAVKLEFDPAILRKERLIENIEVPLLGAQHANTVYRRLSGNEGTYDRPTSLADVYNACRPLKGTGQWKRSKG